MTMCFKGNHQFPIFSLSCFQCDAIGSIEVKAFTAGVVR